MFLSEADAKFVQLCKKLSKNDPETNQRFLNIIEQQDKWLKELVGRIEQLKKEAQTLRAVIKARP